MPDATGFMDGWIPVIFITGLVTEEFERLEARPRLQTSWRIRGRLLELRPSHATSAPTNATHLLIIRKYSCCHLGPRRLVITSSGFRG